MAEGGAALRLPPDALPAGLEPGRDLSIAEWDGLARRSEYERLMARALRLLSRRERFSAELARRLSEWQPGKPRPDVAQVGEVLARCRELGYLDDARALKLTLESALAQGSIGPARLRELLMQRGCPPQLTRVAMVEFSQRFDEGAAARALLLKRRASFAAKLKRLREKAFAKAGRKAAAQRGVGPEDSASELPGGRPRRPPARRVASQAQLARTVSAQLGLAVLSYLAARGLSGEAARDAARRFTAELLAIGDGAGT